MVAQLQISSTPPSRLLLACTGKVAGWRKSLSCDAERTAEWHDIQRALLLAGPGVQQHGGAGRWTQAKKRTMTVPRRWWTQQTAGVQGEFLLFPESLSCTAGVPIRGCASCASSLNPSHVCLQIKYFFSTIVIGADFLFRESFSVCIKLSIVFLSVYSSYWSSSIFVLFPEYLSCLSAN